MKFRVGEYKRDIIRQSDQIELVEITWEPGDRTKKHNHGRSKAWITVLQGRVFEVRDGKKRYYEPDGDLVLEVPAGVAHIVGNDSDAPVITIHIFMPKLEMEYFEDDESDALALAEKLALAENEN